MSAAAHPLMTSEDVARFDEEVAAEPDIFEQFSEDAETEAAADARAEAEIEAGRVVSHEAVRRWIHSWGSGRELPRPEPGE